MKSKPEGGGNIELPKFQESESYRAKEPGTTAESQSKTKRLNKILEILKKVIIHA